MQVRGNPDDPYLPVIERFLRTEIGGRIDNRGVLLDALTEVLVGTNNLRYGPRPSPEQLVSIRQVITHHTEQGTPIPFLVPWGSRKPNIRHSVDVAELMGLRVMVDLHERIGRHYNPGAMFSIRVEDTNAEYMFRRETVNGPAVAQYRDRFVKLAQVVRGGVLIPHPESELMDPFDYLNRTAALVPIIEAYINQTDTHADDAKRLPASMIDIGWKGIIPDEQREFYRSRYRKLYPNENAGMTNRRLAEYFAGSLARYQLGGTGAPNEPFITLSFVPPVPGTPDSLASRRLYYRTLPASMARSHMPGWRAKGYLRIGEGTVTPKITSFQDLPSDLHQCVVTLTSDDGECSTDLQTDYQLV